MTARELAPDSVSQLASQVQAAEKDGVGVHAVGAGLHRHLGPPETATGYYISTTRLDAILDHQPDDLTVTVQAGCRLGTIQERLARAGQWLPYRPALGRHATMGGLLATHSPSLTRMGHGSLRDRVLGMSVVLASGAVVKSGGRVVKNVTGYDLHRLHTGAWGTLGILVEVCLKVAPLPPGRTLVRGPVPDAGRAVRFARQLAAGCLFPVAIVLGRGVGDDGLWIALEDVALARERAAREIIEKARAFDIRHLEIVPDANVPDTLVDFGGEPGFGVRAGLPPSRLDVALAALPGDARYVADLGEGTVSARLTAPDLQQLKGFGSACRGAGGWAALTCAPEQTWRALAPTVTDPASERMAAIRRSLDPRGILNPGRSAAVPL